MALANQDTQFFKLGQIAWSFSQAQLWGAKARSTVPTKAFREALMSRYQGLKIEGGVFFYTLALVDRGSDLLVGFGE